jgi:hypothetical protein
MISGGLQSWNDLILKTFPGRFIKANARRTKGIYVYGILLNFGTLALRN